MTETNKLNDPSRSPLTGHPQPGPERMQSDLQIDPELAEGPASGGRIVAFGAAIVIVLGLVFYGMNNTAKTPDATSTAATQSTPVSTPPTGTNTAQQASAPGQSADSKAAPPAAATNAAPGITTGAAPSNTQGPKSSPTGTEIDRSKTGGNAATK